jgi:hypothetical protein
MSPYQLVYRKTYHLPIEIEFKAHWANNKWNMDLEAARVKRKMQLSELNEWREKAYHNARMYKERTKSGMTRGSRRRASLRKIRYYFLIIG